MNYLLACLLTVSSLCSFAQKNLKVDVGNTTSTLSLVERQKQEGMQLDGTFSLSPSAYTFDGTSVPETNGNTAPGGVSYQFGITRAGICTEIGIATTADAYFTFTVGIANGGPRRMVSASSGLTLIPPATTILPRQFVAVAPNGLVRPVTNSKYVVTSYYTAYKFSADLRYNASRRIYFIGDSNLEATSIAVGANLLNGSVSMFDVMSWKLRKKYLDAGNDVRIIDKSIAGKSSIDFEQYRKDGKLNLPEAPHIIFYALGTNDTDVPTYSANLNAFLSWALTEWPATKIVVLGPVPKQATETIVAQIRTAAANVVSTLANSRVTYLNCGLIFSLSDSNVNTKYSGTETTGAGVHLSPAGHTDWAEYIWANLPTAFKTL